MKKPKKSNTYFTADTEKWIVEYNSSTDPVYRAKIFTEHIYYPFYKLAENLIHRFKFYYTDVENLEDLKHEIITLLLEDKIMKFNPEYGAKAYSYFGTIVKRWLINYNAQNYKKLRRDMSIDSVDVIEDNPKFYTELSGRNLAINLNEWVKDIQSRLDNMFPKKQERKVAEAILTLFEKRGMLEVFKKKALYIYIREMTDCETPIITNVIGALKVDYYTYTTGFKSEYDILAM
jgi:hypothetical protein